MLAGDERSSSKLSKRVLASYGAPALPLALVGLPMAVYLPAVYADADGFGLTLGMVGLILTLSRLTDVVTDPVIGFVSDRLKTRWGRRKPFILVGTPIYAAGIWLLFVPPITFSEVQFLGLTFNSGYPYLFLMVTLVYLGSTIKDLPYVAWGAELSQNYNERTLITSWREGFAVAGSLLSAFTPAILLFAGYVKPTDAVYFLSVAMCIVMPVLVLNALLVVPEHPVLSRPQKMPLKESLKVVLQNEPYVLLIVIFVFSTLGSAMTNSLSFFFVKHVLLAGDLYGLYLAPYFLSQILAIPIWFGLSRRIGKHRATMFAIGWYALWSCFIPLIALAPGNWFTAFEIPLVLSFLPEAWHTSIVTRFEGMETGKFLLFIVIMCLKGSAIGALAALPAAMAADVIDLDTMKTGEKRAGAYFSIWSMTRKASYALGITIGTGTAVLFGFDSLADPVNSPNSPSSLLWLACLYSVIPALFKFVAMPLLWRYPLTEARLSEIQTEIQKARANSTLKVV
ncbi:MAG: MFS transporter [Pseudomonadales bacterium]|nr:MFS transporter [Pseudomonadales bacterium]MDA0957172.1 MFS transporter [Pseudomonadota bacterium]MDA1206942.1 MFS transporter [Pseudomonadota bacterium]